MLANIPNQLTCALLSLSTQYYAANAQVDSFASSRSRVRIPLPPQTGHLGVVTRTRAGRLPVEPWSVPIVVSPACTRGCWAGHNLRGICVLVQNWVNPGTVKPPPRYGNLSMRVMRRTETDRKRRDAPAASGQCPGSLDGPDQHCFLHRCGPAVARSSGIIRPTRHDLGELTKLPARGVVACPCSPVNLAPHPAKEI